jgi:hypothetical protein
VRSWRVSCAWASPGRPERLCDMIAGCRTRPSKSALPAGTTGRCVVIGSVESPWKDPLFGVLPVLPRQSKSRRDSR